MRDIVESTAEFHRWLGKQVVLLQDDLRFKHLAMAKNSVAFLRATYYRWAETFPKLCRSAKSAPTVLAVGDLHVENFGLWRDAEGRSVWGINDFDECAALPYVNDLIRLATSARLAAADEDVTVSVAEICDVVLDGYAAEWESGGKPIVVVVADRWLRSLLPEHLRRPKRFWKKIRASQRTSPKEKIVRAAAEASLPDATTERKCGHRIAGLGSLGRPRVVAWGMWHGGPVAREAKQLALPATEFVSPSRKPTIRYAEMLAHAVRAADPFCHVAENIVIRRLAPESGKIEVDAIAEIEDQRRLLYFMGRETANVHLGTPTAGDAIRKHLKKSRDRIAADVQRMTEQTLQDWHAWRRWYQTHRKD